jgi:6-phosphogluconolactonase
MIKPEIHVHADLEALSIVVAHRFVELAQERTGHAGRFSVALSGGSTPRRLYELLGSPEVAPKISWGKVHLFQVDERCVPPDHPSSNYRMICESLRVPAGVPAQSIHRIQGELGSENAASEYVKDLENSFSAHPPEFPRLDLVLLGMGADGHVASLFPGSRNLSERTRWMVPSEPGPEGLERVTMTLPVLNAAAHIIYLVTGIEKSDTLARVLNPQSAHGALPAQGITPAAGALCWHVDTAAASKLRNHKTV